MLGPWYITPSAARDYMRIRGWQEDAANYEQAIGDLIKIAKEIVATGKAGTPTGSGHLSYRTGRAHGRMGLVVSSVPRVEGDLPQLIAVTRSRH